MPLDAYDVDSIRFNEKQGARELATEAQKCFEESRETEGYELLDRILSFAGAAELEQLIEEYRLPRRPLPTPPAVVRPVRTGFALH